MINILKVYKRQEERCITILLISLKMKLLKLISFMFVPMALCATIPQPTELDLSKQQVSVVKQNFLKVQA